MSEQPFDTVVFCDFDGTITVHETLCKMFLHFIPDQAQHWLGELEAGRITLREALVHLIGAVPSDCRDAIIDFLAPEPIRPGFGELLDDLKARDIPLVVLSSGMRFYIEALLAPFLDRIHTVHALDVDASGPTLKVRLDNDHPTEAMPKAWVMERYPARCHIAIGDSRSDFEMAKAADRVFARDRLLAKLQDEGRPVEAFEDFHQIRAALRRG